MPLPTPNKDEQQSEFIQRCESALSEEFPETAQRTAVCFRQWRKAKEDDMATKGLIASLKPDGAGELAIYDTIGEGMFYDGFTAKELDDKLHELRGVRQLDVRINSQGGDVFQGITVYNRLRAFPAVIRVFIDGIAASIASVIALAGDEVIAYTSSSFMVHKPMALGVSGNEDELESVIGQLRLIKTQMLKVYQDKTGLDTDVLEEMLSHENGRGTWMASYEALDLGFIDRVETDVAIAACACPEGDQLLPWLKCCKKPDEELARMQSEMRRIKQAGVEQNRTFIKHGVL